MPGSWVSRGRYLRRSKPISWTHREARVLGRGVGLPIGASPKGRLAKALPLRQCDGVTSQPDRPDGWIFTAWPKPLTEEAVTDERLRLNHMTLVRHAYSLVPEHFSLGIQSPELQGDPVSPPGIIVSYQAHDDGTLSVTMMAAYEVDLEKALEHITEKLPMPAWRRIAVEEIVRYLANDDVRRRVPQLKEVDFTQSIVADGEEPPLPRTKKRYRITKEHLAEVVRVYTEAVEHGDPPTREVADMFEVAHSTAAKWVGQARREGMLEGVSQKWGSRKE